MAAKAQGRGDIRVGVGGWTFEPWRGSFFPEGLAHAKELGYASRQLTAIEINGTYYRTQTPKSFAKWAAETPDGFVFTVKAVRYATNRKVLAEAGESVATFVNSGLNELGDKLGAILWQFMPTKRFDPEDFGGFLKLLPPELAGRRLRHAVEVRHDSFCTPQFVEMAREANVAIVYADSTKYPAIADVTSDFVYARLESAREAEPTGYSAAELDRWSKVATRWAEGGAPEDIPTLTPTPPSAERDVFVFMINGAKVRAPAAAKGLLERL